MEWCTGGPWFNETICRNLHGPIFQEFLVTAYQDRYNIICGIHDYNKKDKSNDAPNFGGGRPLPEYSIINPLVSICVSINFMDTWINALAKKIEWHCWAYQEKTK